MLKLVSFQNQHFFNDTSLSKKISELFYEKGFPFSQTIIAKPEDLQKIKAQAVSDNENYYVFLNPAEYVIGKNVRSIKEIALEKDCLAVINELELTTGRSYGKCILRVFGVDPLILKGVCEKVVNFIGNNNVSFNVHTEFLDTKIIISYDNSTSKMAVDGVIRIFAEDLNEYLYATDDTSLTDQLFNLLKLRGKTISVAESFTSGRIASAIVSKPGASEIFYEGIVAYSNLSKEDRLGVTRETLANYGAVSPECCSEMVEGLLNTGRCDIAISSTGIAGPASDNTKKPVGLCYIGVGMESGIEVFKYNLGNTREEITETAVRAALFNAVKRLKYM